MRTMRLYWFILLGCSLLISCKEVSYPEPQPKGVPTINEIPATLHGQYLTRDKSTGETGDTLIIEGWGYRFKDSEDKDWLGQGRLSDSLVVKYYQNYYFVNIKDGDQWVLRLMRVKSPGVLELLSIDLQDDKRQKDIVKKLSRKLPVREIQQKDDVFYQIDPTPAQLMNLIKDGYFTGIELRKIR